jgi:hypothetical protein
MGDVSRAISSKNADSSERSCSGSWRTASSVERARSANSTVTSLRSSDGGIVPSVATKVSFPSARTRR